MTPKAIFDAYVSGTISRRVMIERIADYPFAHEPLTDGYDWTTSAADGPTWIEVSAAIVEKKITREDYAAIRALRNSRS